MSLTYVAHPVGHDPVERSAILHNPRLRRSGKSQDTDLDIERLHRQLPDYGETKLYSLPDVARELGCANVFIKDESTRFGLPSFKIAGASWAIYRALCQHAGLPKGTPMTQLKQALKLFKGLRLVTCTEGNWGRATARMARYLGVKVTVFVPGFMEEYTQNLIRQEGAEVVFLKDADYDESLAAAVEDSHNPDSILALDVGFEGYHDIPQWVTDGYSVILQEVDRQIFDETGAIETDIVLCSVGAGSWAQSIVAHFRGGLYQTTLCSVEPDTAACLKESLHRGKNTSIKTGHTIMNGMNCGTISSVAWPTLRDNIDFAIVVTDQETHACVQELQRRGINAGPCGAANLAALRRLADTDSSRLAGKTVVLFSTEGIREYEMHGQTC